MNNETVAFLRYPGGKQRLLRHFLQHHWWHVPVRPSRWPKRMFELYEALADVEDAIQEREHLNILLATGRPLEEEEPEMAAV